MPKRHVTKNSLKNILIKNPQPSWNHANDKGTATQRNKHNTTTKKEAKMQTQHSPTLGKQKAGKSGAIRVSNSHRYP